MLPRDIVESDVFGRMLGRRAARVFRRDADVLCVEEEAAVLWLPRRPGGRPGRDPPPPPWSEERRCFWPPAAVHALARVATTAPSH